MKRTYLILPALLALAACTQNEFYTDTPGDGKLVAVIVDESAPTTKTLLTDYVQAKADLTWAEGDQIGAFGSESGANVSFVIEPGDIAEGGLKATLTAKSGSPKGRVTAYYPYQKDAAMDAAGNLLLTFPTVQQYIKTQGSVQPDPAAGFLAGRTTGSQVNFYTVGAMLKLRYVGEPGDVVSKIVFDAGGQQVNGRFRLGWDDNTPTMAWEKGGGSTIELQTGKDGVTMDGSLHNFYIVVPAGTYSGGFKLHIHTKAGRVVTKTAPGKVEIERGKIYPMGEAVKESAGKYKLKKKVSWMDEDRAQYIIDVVRGTTAAGGGAYTGSIPCLTLTVTDQFKPVLGEILLFPPSTLFPDGFYAKVTSIDSANPKRLVVGAVPPDQLGDVFEELRLGSVTFDASGNPKEDKSLEIDLASYLMRIETADGKSIDYSTRGSEVSMYLPSTVFDEPQTRASYKTEFDTGKLSYTYDFNKYAHMTIAAGMKIALKLAASITDGDIDYVHFGLTPQLTVELGADITGEVRSETDKYLFTAIFAPIPVPPVVITPKIDVYAIAGAVGELKAQVNVSLNTSGNVGFSYVNPKMGEAGFVARANNFKAGADISADLSGSVQVFGGLRTDMGLSVCKVFETYLSVDSKAALQATASTSSANTKLALLGQVEAKGVLSALFYKGLETSPVKWESAPLWEANVHPDFVNLARPDMEFRPFKGSPDDPNPTDTLYIRVRAEGSTICNNAYRIHLQRNYYDGEGVPEPETPERGFDPYKTIATWGGDRSSFAYGTGDKEKVFEVRYLLHNTPGERGNETEIFRRSRHKLSISSWNAAIGKEVDFVGSSEIFRGSDVP